MNTTKLKNKLIKLSLVFSLVFLLGINDVKADKPYSIKPSDNSYTNINMERVYENSKTIMVCSYGCGPNNMGSGRTQCGQNNETFSAITFDQNNENKWNIQMNLYLAAEYNTTANSIYKYTWNNTFGNVIPYSGIYFENPNKNGKVNEVWKDTTAYKNLQTSFNCPKYMYYDQTIDSYSADYKKNNMELCYANDKEKCKTRNETNKTTFENANKLKYSFVEELNDVLTYTNDDIMLTKPEDMLLKYYDSEESICTAFNLDRDNFTNGYDVNYPAFLKQSFEKYTVESPNKFIYNHEEISKLLGSDNLNLTYESIPLKAKYDAIKENYVNKMRESIKYYSEKCEVPEDVSEIIANEVSEDLTEKIDKLDKSVVEYENIDREALDCENLFAGIADLLKTAYFLIEIGSILIVVILSVIDYAKVFLADNQDAMKKANQHLMKRIIILVVIFLLPALVNLTLKIFKIKGFDTDTPLCVEIKG